jgi:hypothetical protein
MFTFLATMAFDYIFQAMLVGITFFAVFGHESEFVQSKKVVVVFMIIFALLDLYWLPAVEVLDVSVKFGNSSMAKLLGAKEEYIKLSEIVSLGWFDIFEWLAKSAIAWFSGNFVYERITRRGLTSGSS